MITLILQTGKLGLEVRRLTHGLTVSEPQGREGEPRSCEQD